MSRTDKDAPFWVRTEFYEPDHTLACPFYLNRRWQKLGRPSRPCDLPEIPVRRNFVYSWKHWEKLGCHWTAVWDRSYGDRPLNAADRHTGWWGPDRAQARDQCHSAKREYNGYSDVDTVPYTQHHRHCSKKGWW